MFETVTSRAKSVKQPRGGYIPPSAFHVTALDDGIVLHDAENVHGSVIGMVVDYMTRFLLGEDITECFRVAIRGAVRAESAGIKDAVELCGYFLFNIKGLDDDSIIYACKAVTFDVWGRNPMNALQAKSHDETNPDSGTIENIRTLINRTLSFWKEYGPITASGFTFEPEGADPSEHTKALLSNKTSFGGYTPTVATGDGDYLTKDTVWDLKVAKTKPKSQQTLQLLMYWIMGQHSGQTKFKGINKIGIFNPRFNTIWQLDIDEIVKETIESVEREVICYT